MTATADDTLTPADLEALAALAPRDRALLLVRFRQSLAILSRPKRARTPKTKPAPLARWISVTHD
jgi:hypothetical protein